MVISFTVPAEKLHILFSLLFFNLELDNMRNICIAHLNYGEVIFDEHYNETFYQKLESI